MSTRTTGASSAGASFNGHQRAVDVQFQHHQRGDDFGRRRSCPTCGLVHSEGAPCRLFDEQRGDPEHNGPYRGALPVLVLPPGVSGADLVRARRLVQQAGRRVRLGQLWAGPAMRSYRVAAIHGSRVTLAPVCGPHQVKVYRQTLLRSSRWSLLAEAR